jgi:hypothetical protein
MSALFQKQTLAALLDHLVGTTDQRWRQLNAEGSRGFQINEELKMRWHLKRQISRSGSTQDSGDKITGAFANLALARPI